MNNRTSTLMVVGALSGCLVLVACIVIGAAGFLVYRNNNPLSSNLFPAALVAPPPPAEVNQIAFVGNDLNIYVTDPVNGKPLALTSDGGTGHAYNYPTWAPDNRHLAFVGYTFQNGDPTKGDLYSITPSGEKLTSLYSTDQNFPFYVYWSPDSQFVTWLSNKDAQTISLRIAKPDQADSMLEVESGAPLYYAWAPDSSHMFAHVGGTRQESADAWLALLEPKTEDAKHPLENEPGSFQAPQWSHTGHLLYSKQSNGGEAVAEADAQGKELKQLFEYDGRVSFTQSPDAKHVAYIVTKDNSRLPTFGPVQVVDAEGANPQDVSKEPALAFLWSPDSTKLAFLTVSVADNQSNFEINGHAFDLASLDPNRVLGFILPEQGGDTRIQLHWKIWDTATGQVQTLANFLPTQSFLSLVPYFDQYALSSTFWSPDSQSFVYTTRDSDSDGSVFVVDVNGTSTPRKVGDGLIAFWSWK